MTNAELECFLSEPNLELSWTSVGDGYVIAEIRKDNYNVGGHERSPVRKSDTEAVILIRAERDDEKAI